MAISDDLQAAQDEYGSSASPYASLSDYLMQRPAYDRGPRAAPAAPTMRTLDAITPDTDQLLANQYEQIMAEQRDAQEASEAARQTEIDSLRDLLREDLATSEDAALGQRSELTKALEAQIEDMRRGVDAETIDLRQAGLDERAALARQIEEGDKLVREAQVQAIGDLEDRQGSLVGDLKERIGSLSSDLSSINSVIDQNYSELVNIQEASSGATQEQISGINQELESLSGTQSEIDTLNQQLETLYADVDSGNVDQSELLRGEVSDLIAGLEGKIGGIQENLGALPIDQIQAELATVNDQTAAFQQAIDTAGTERTDLAARIEALQAAGLTQDDLSGLSESIASQRQTDITSALDPVQQQIEALRGEIPGEIDAEALRKQITEDIMAQMANQAPPSGGGTGDTDTDVDVGDVVVEPSPGFSGTPYENFMGGFIPGGGSAAAMNVSDGQADAMGLFDDPRDYTQYDPGDYVRSTVPAPIMGTKQGGMPGGGPGFGYVKTGAPIAYNQGPFQVQKFDNELFNRTSFGM
jgi:flagellar hook-basal body complex protein FliE